MLMLLGPVQFQIAPFNAHGIDHQTETTHVEKPVLGAMPPVEHVGEGAETWTIQGRIFPERFGGLGDLRKLHDARRSGLPQYLMRGDGAMMGWVVIERVQERSAYLGPGGVGRVIDITINVRRAQAPGAASYFSIMGAIFG